jgi:aspartyl-tRNA(Asn)/glutamyl-tRNA(Gln) amidotransferase subunit A
VSPGSVEAATGLPALGATALQELLRTGEVDAADALAAHQSRIDATEPLVHALVHRVGGPTPGEADAGAVLAGLPVVIKDNVAVAGMPLTCASRARLGEAAAQSDAELVRRIRSAGGVVIAKANLDEFAMGASTETSCFGPTHNPLALDRTPGGSSGGSAATVAAFQVPLAIGTDTGGSTREPAAQCGLVGVKPSLGSVPTDGVVPFAPSLDQPGPLARHVADAALLHDVIAGTDGELSHAAMRGARTDDLRGLRVAVVPELCGARNAVGVRARFGAAVDLLTRLGAEVVELSCPSVDAALETYFAISSVECLPTLEGPAASGLLGDEALRRYAVGESLVAEPGAIETAQLATLQLKKELGSAFEQVPVLLSPTMPITAARLGGYLDDPLAVPRTDCWTVVANLTGVPALSLPSGRSPADGLPVGLQLMAPLHQDARLYELGATLEAAGLAGGGPGAPPAENAPDYASP